MVSISNIAAQSAASQAQKAQLNQDFDDFLTLLTTQLQNQDPLEPMDSNEFTNQLVQFSQVEQQLATNDLLEDMRALSVLNTTQLGLGFVGMDVEVTGDSFQYSGQGPVDLGYALPAASKDTTISIKNADGETVYSVDGETSSGIKSFQWDGKNKDGFAVPAGDYTIEVSALNEAGKSLIVPTSVPGRVDGIESDDSGEVLLLVGNQKLSISDVTRAKLPAQTAVN